MRTKKYMAEMRAGTHLRLTHAGFADEKSKKQHQPAWPIIFEQLDKKIDSIIEREN